MEVEYNLQLPLKSPELLEYDNIYNFFLYDFWESSTLTQKQ